MSEPSHPRYCKICYAEIPKARLEAIPETVLCVTCSEKYGPKPKKGFMVTWHSKGTAPVLVTVDPDDQEAMRLATRANRRRR